MADKFLYETLDSASELGFLKKENVERKFSDILRSSELIQGTAGRIRKLRLYLIDNTFVDIWYSPDGSYSYHSEQRKTVLVFLLTYSWKSVISKINFR